ncbi:MAG TPA: hypothetical protein VIN11_09315 [Roseivirga sp.]
MNSRRVKYFFLASILIQMFVVTSLATASPLLTIPVIKGGSFPWGNLLTAVLFVLFPINFLLMRSTRKIHPIPMKVFRACILTSVVFGILWLPITYLLSGNWSASFSGQDFNSKIWWMYTYTAPLLPFIGYFLMRILMIFFRQQSNATKN